MPDCIFCKIIKEEILFHRVYEDENNLAFLDIKPSAFGHTLIIPKKHFENILDIDEQSLKSLILAVQKTGKIIQEKFKPSGIKVIQRNGQDAGQEIGHVHFHIMPCFGDNGYGYDNDNDNNHDNDNDREKMLKGAIEALTK